MPRQIHTHVGRASYWDIPYVIILQAVIQEDWHVDLCLHVNATHAASNVTCLSLMVPVDGQAKADRGSQQGCAHRLLLRPG